MKKILFILILCVASLTSYAQCFETKALATKDNTTNVWSDWKPCEVSVCFGEGRLTIYSQQPQIYEVAGFEDASINGEIIYLYYCYDNEGIRCTLRFRQYVDHNIVESQLYIEYSNVTWVYNLTQDA